jgi:hypothetical protein
MEILGNEVAVKIVCQLAVKTVKTKQVRTTGKAGGLKDCEPLKAVY